MNNNSKITFYVVRHGKTLMNTQNRVQGWSDSPLTPEGVEMARFVGLGMRDILFRSAYCSTLNRTKHTAQIILKAKGQSDVKVVELDGLKEACFGSFESESTSHLWGTSAHYLGYESSEIMYKAVLSGELSYREIIDAISLQDELKQAENYKCLKTRTQQTLKEIARNEAQKGDGNILVVSHGMSILAMLMSLGGDKIARGHVENVGVCKVVYEGSNFSVESMNDLSFIENGREEKDNN